MRLSNHLIKVIFQEQGSALATVLIISVIVSLFIGLVLSGVVIQNRFIQRDINSMKALYAAEEAVYVFLNAGSSGAKTPDTSLTVFLSDGSSAEVFAQSFGGYLDVMSSALVKNQYRTVRMLIGERADSIFNYAVALGDTNSALSVSGNTSITGDIITGGEGLREITFKGVPFTGEIRGDREVYSQTKIFPDYDSESLVVQLNHYDSFFGNELVQNYTSNYSGMPSHNFSSSDTVFFDGSISWTSKSEVGFPMGLTIFVNGNMTLNGAYQFRPFTKVIVRDTILVGGNVSASDVLFYAGKSVQIGGAFSGSAQTLSRGNIVIRDNAYLRYPSFIFSSNEFVFEEGREVIHIANNSKIDGTILFPFQANDFSGNQPSIKLDEHALIRGAIYNRGKTEIKGKVFGSVLTYQFSFHESPTTYINRLYNNSIDVLQRPENYVLPIGFVDSTKYEILNWFEIRN